MAETVISALGATTSDPASGNGTTGGLADNNDAQHSQVPSLGFSGNLGNTLPMVLPQC